VRSSRRAKSRIVHQDGLEVCPEGLAILGLVLAYSNPRHAARPHGIERIFFSGPQGAGQPEPHVGSSIQGRANFAGSELQVTYAATCLWVSPSDPIWLWKDEEWSVLNGKSDGRGIRKR
ncbi:uncharacterized protein PpBr36_06504, partial [Pyricularia pennisetigena]|uniref:uncharacterized protein n=1 Tax=Pyricularia pennisetigena TaxID=1578925 RepID=UPI00114F8F26